MNNVDLYKKLKKSKYALTKQQYKTIKGQIQKGDLEGANKGIIKCLNRSK